MGKIETEPVMADLCGVPQFFVTVMRGEDAGDGCARLYGCIKQGHILMPQYSVVLPVPRLLMAASFAADLARKILKGDGSTH